MTSTSRRPSRLLSERQSDKLAQIIQNFFLKSTQIITQSRSTSIDDDNQGSLRRDASPNGKVNKWFNLELSSDDSSKDDLLSWKTKDILSLPPLVIETYLDLRGLDTNQTLLLNDSIVKTNKKSEVVLERWLMEFDLSLFDNDNLELPSIYKKVIIMMRSLYLLLRLLPTFKLRDELIKSKLKTVNPLKVSFRILDGSKTITSKGRIGLSKKLGHQASDNSEHLKSRKLEPILTPIGALKLSVSYRINCNFQLNDNEELLSSQFMLGQQIPLASTKGDSYESERTSIQSPIEYHKHRLSSTSMSLSNSSPRRRSSNRSVQLFKVGSLNSSSSPPPMHTNNSQQMVPPISSFSTSKPIPVTLNRNNSSASLVAMLRQNRESLPKSIGSMDPSATQQLLTSTSASASASTKFSSSFGSRFRNTSSRHNSLEGQLLPVTLTPTTQNPILQTFRSRNKSLSISSSDMGPSSSIYMDEDLDSFVKMLDSKPDLSFSSNSPSIYDDSLLNFKNLQKSNDFFNSDQRSPLPPSQPVLHQQSPLQHQLASSQSNQQQSLLFKKNFQIEHQQQNRRPSQSSLYSPPHQVLLKPSPSTATSTITTPSISYAKFNSHPISHSGSPSNSSLTNILRRSSSSASTSKRPLQLLTGSQNQQVTPSNSVSASATTTTIDNMVNSSTRSKQLTNPELLKLRSFNEEVFDESDDESDPHHHSHNHRGSSPPVSSSLARHKFKINGVGMTLHQHLQQQQQQQQLQGQGEDDEDELLFAMSDMTLAKNNQEF
ncbi:hypothetical protein CANARDRAFT_29784 [[Candida] arabinofermentans NRRL YB-2248]|uniref:Autophagy-related protein 13 n=1 Tax=[Candida] arabinofermentans NRRL YB-2248 TaxID=983967 RepID=A0A1E4SVL9_9ASCO|nr:hypothetical protein CANARDRAFT_29784 [[Candida] arabinofermentans NRRL YB-2248]